MSGYIVASVIVIGSLWAMAGTAIAYEIFRD